eukprot:NODE_2194_length_628_cov_24.065868_g2144_i0.p2 GENE.NODE_2194_length_628_cov_24.065868_g2144_i0~~NODE_2194_length_628_cov_24.065868_g2144_i0.p2  ORF type:complete len:145 (+),score=19.06 NODE_2194_length_628_cov_24.065868_g2144_i0:84-518(+)
MKFVLLASAFISSVVSVSVVVGGASFPQLVLKQSGNPARKELMFNDNGAMYAVLDSEGSNKLQWDLTYIGGAARGWWAVTANGDYNYEYFYECNAQHEWVRHTGSGSLNTTNPSDVTGFVCTTIPVTVPSSMLTFEEVGFVDCA